MLARSENDAEERSRLPLEGAYLKDVPMHPDPRLRQRRFAQAKYVKWFDVPRYGAVPPAVVGQRSRRVCSTRKGHSERSVRGYVLACGHSSGRYARLVEYGGYVLGAETDEYAVNWENTIGQYLYQTRFEEQRPLLDIGPGRCWFTRQAPQDIVALELDAGLVARYQREGLDIRQGSIYELPFEDGSFGGVFCCWVFEHLAEPAKAASEIRRVLRPDAPLCLIVPSERQIGHGFYDDITHVRPYTEASLKQLANLGGFASHQVEPLVWTTGMNRVRGQWGDDAAQRFLRVMDGAGRRIGIVNRMMLVLDARA